MVYIDIIKRELMFLLLLQHRKELMNATSLILRSHGLGLSLCLYHLALRQERGLNGSVGGLSSALLGQNFLCPDEKMARRSCVYEPLVIDASLIL